MSDHTNIGEAAEPPAEDRGPYLIIAAFWQETDNTADVAKALRSEFFPFVEGYSHGAVVAFRREVADAYNFRRDLARFDLAELNERPAGAGAGTPGGETT